MYYRSNINILTSSLCYVNIKIVILIILNKYATTILKKYATNLEIQSFPEVYHLDAFLAGQMRLEQDPCTIRS